MRKLPAVLALVLAVLSVGQARAAAPTLARPEGRKPGIIATLGRDAAQATGLVRAGAEVLRINLSHGGVRELRAKKVAIADARRVTGRNFAVLADLPGGKIRAGTIPGGGTIELVAGRPFEVLTGARTTTTAGRAWVGRMLPKTDVGDVIQIDDGRIELEVTGVSGTTIQTQVRQGGTLRSNAGVNVQGKEPRFPSMTSKDRRKLTLALEGGATWIGVSMVQGPHNVTAVRRALVRAGRPDVKVIAKIESWSAIDNLDAILDASDGVMIARGDLLTAVGPKELPRLQALIATRATAKGKPFIAATNFLSAMIDGKPASAANRADVRRAAKQGPDWFMLNETALSPTPVAVVDTMRRLLAR